MLGDRDKLLKEKLDLERKEKEKVDRFFNYQYEQAQHIKLKRQEEAERARKQL